MMHPLFIVISQIKLIPLNFERARLAKPHRCLFRSNHKHPRADCKHAPNRDKAKAMVIHISDPTVERPPVVSTDKLSSE
jgi:hypothetical protein